MDTVWLVLVTDELGWRSVAAVAATREIAEYVVEELHLAAGHDPDLEHFDDRSSLCRVAVCGIQVNPAEVER